MGPEWGDDSFFCEQKKVALVLLVQLVKLVKTNQTNKTN
jgi:hypothetical protein